MVNTRSRPSGTEVPDVAPVTSPTAPTTAKPKGTGKKAAPPQVSDRSAEDGRRAEQSGMPSEFRFQSPAREVKPPPTYEQEERVVEDELDGESIVQSGNTEPCPPEERIAKQAACPSEASIAAELACPSVRIDRQATCPTESIDRQATCPTERIDRYMACPTTGDTQEWRETMHLDREEPASRAYMQAYGRAATPSFVVEHEATTIAEAAYGGGYCTPKQVARVTGTRVRAGHQGAQYFPKTFDNANIDVPEPLIDEPDIEEESRSDETLRAQQNMSRRSRETLQHAEDLTFLQALIGDKNRRRRMRELLPEIKTNDKSLLKEIQEALESSSEEYDAFGWETDQQDEFQMPEPGPSKSQAQPEAGPTYFDKGKWQRDEHYEAQIKYRKAQVISREAEEAHRKKISKESSRKPAEGRKKPRVSIGIAVDDVRRQAECETNRSHTARDINTSIAALPGGGYFAKKMRARSEVPEQARTDLSTHTPKKAKDNSSESDSSESESLSDGSSSSSEKSREQRKRDKYRKKAKKAEKELKCLQRAGVKTKLPMPYRGQDNYDEFELWDYEVDQWLADTRYKGQEAVRRIGTFLKDKAAHWYMDHVAPDPGAYNVNSLKISLYNYCFPPDLKAKLRREFRYTRQGSKEFTDYLQELKRFQRRLPDITDRQICIKLWDTVNTYIKIKWAESGLDAEDSSLTELSQSAERSENAERIRREMRHQVDPGSSQEDPILMNEGRRKTVSFVRGDAGSDSSENASESDQDTSTSNHVDTYHIGYYNEDLGECNSPNESYCSQPETRASDSSSESESDEYYY